MTWHDPEAIWTEKLDADLEIAELKRAAHRADALRKRGVCPHGAMRSRDPVRHREPLDEEQARVPIGGLMCCDCGKTWETEDEGWAEHFRLVR